jgi:2-haloacid dehalogenase
MSKRAEPLRRLRLAALAGLAVAAVLACAPGPAAAGGRPAFKAVAFDFLVLFDPDSIVADVERAFPGKGRALTNAWRTRQFEYAWLRSLSGRYVDFFAITDDALVYAAQATGVTLTPDDRRSLLDAYLHLAPWPDAADTLRRLREAGVRVVTLANFSPAMLRANVERAGLSGAFDALISTDASHTYKPAPKAYRLGMDRLHMAKRDILFVAFGGWDAAGAKAFGYPTYWVNRFGQPMEELGVRPDRTSPDLSGLLEYVLAGPATAGR